MHCRIKIGIIDDTDMVRRVLKQTLLSSRLNLQVIFDIGSMQELDSFSSDGSVPDVIFLDIDMPLINGSEGVPLVLKKYPSCKIIMFTATENMNIIRLALKNGASVYLKKSASRTEIEQTILAVSKGTIRIEQPKRKLMRPLKIAKEAAYG